MTSKEGMFIIEKIEPFLLVNAELHLHFVRLVTGGGGLAKAGFFEKCLQSGIGFAIQSVQSTIQLYNHVLKKTRFYKELRSYNQCMKSTASIKAKSFCMGKESDCICIYSVFYLVFPKCYCTF